MRQKRSYQSKRRPGKGKRHRPAAKAYAKTASPGLRSRGTVGEGSSAALERGRKRLLGWVTRTGVARRDARTGRFVTYRSDEAIKRASERFAEALKRLADK